ncbi:NAD(P)-dependent alcohol dehydrogenase [Pelagibacterium xiamenense]|uniref:NAD(P)-dependent alcohol dehydrogenase n=1 Tax=Pelagibacterium xiamenense TaxID=2901140 RepID=UPI001E37BA62|nr:NAD(P)-dependent alcohol dehydrogenase [Pelagibacterium xiamenense]MCD7059942.1 NAD(P)-dependent alcohol dehydrogenase [Pelagibacterium xiamenense]
MKAVVCERYGPPEVLKYTDVPEPTPKDDEILVKMRAASVTLGDCEVRASRVAGWVIVPLRLALGVMKPRQPILGTEMAGDVVAVGANVRNFAVGDRIFGSTSFGMGAYAQFKAVSKSAPITGIPEGVDYATVVGIPTGGLNGLHFVRKCEVKPGESVLINGAGGSIGSFAVQLAKQRGAEVTAVDRGDKLEMLKGLGADHVIDYQTEDFTASGKHYDVIIDVVGKIRFGPTFEALNEGGRLFLGNPYVPHMIQALTAKRHPNKKVLFQLAGESIDDLDYLKALVASGAIKMSIDRHFPLSDIAAAHRYVEAGHKKGIVVIDIPQED